VPRPDSDNSTLLPFLPGRVSFVLPAGIGSCRALPQSLSCPTSAGAYVGGVATFLGSGCVGLAAGGPDVLNYADPVITSVIVTRPSSAADLAIIASNYGAGTDPATIKRLDIFGTAFGDGSYASGFALVGRFIQQLDTHSGPNTWGGDSRFVVPTDAAYWTESHITAFTVLNEGSLRVVLRSGDWAGNALSAASNSFPFADYSPAIALIGLPAPFRTVGAPGWRGMPFGPPPRPRRGCT